ncbi:MAG: hypothetical protein AAFR61_32075 [Bacteroidota bacterium]
MRFFFSFCLACLIWPLQATIITVSNAPASAAAYSDLAQAITAASAGDTLHVEGTGITYSGSNFVIDKRLVLIGPGRFPQGEFASGALVNGLRFQAGSDSSEVHGLYVNGTINTLSTVNHIVITGCYIEYGIDVNGGNWLIRDNIIRGGPFAVNPFALMNFAENATNLQIENNVINGQCYKVRNGTFRNNIMTRVGQTFKGACFNNVLENNIFYGPNALGCSNCTFNNNLTFGSSNDTIPYTGSTGTNNLISQDPLFVNAPLSLNIFLYQSLDFHLQAGSPALNAGTDSKDLGVFGGVSGTVSGNPPIPHIRSVSIDNATVPVGGNLHIKLITTKPEGQ